MGKPNEDFPNETSLTYREKIIESTKGLLRAGSITQDEADKIIEDLDKSLSNQTTPAQ
jgi:hypothetical protein